MKSTHIIAAFSLFAQHCIAASIDLWSGPSVEPRATSFQPIEPEEIIARLSTTPEEYKPEERHPGMAYFCRDENWGPPCFVYDAELHYFCNQFNNLLYRHVGSVFVEAGTICRFAKLNSVNQCRSTTFFAWPETRDGWSDLFDREVPGSVGEKLGYDATHFMCAKCTNCIENPTA